jgi:two-component SAPR family response regulator
MRAIIVDDEPMMIKRFLRLSNDIPGFDIVATFDDPEEALKYVKENPVEAVLLDIEMPGMSGLALAKTMRKKREDIVIVFVTAHEGYIAESNKMGGDYYLLKPYTRDMIELMVDRICLIARRQYKDIYVQMFGRFVVFKNGTPIQLTGKAKEILALIISRCGREISNEEIYNTIWENRPYSNEKMTVYYNALKRLKSALSAESISDILISTTHGQIANVETFDCDYYAWREKSAELRDQFEGEFLSEYSWGEYILADILREEYNL